MHTATAAAARPDQLSVMAAIAPSGRELITARRRLHLKALVILVLVSASYTELVIADAGALMTIVASLVLIFALTAAATCVFHDGSHGAFSTSRWVNRLAGYTGDLLGASSWIWRFKHNNLHHGNTNVVGVDADIDQSPFARLAPLQPWRSWHRYQHVYMWALYGFVTLRWFLIADYVGLLQHGVGRHRFPRQPRRIDLVALLLGKVLHVGWAIALPLAFHPWWVVLVFYLAISWSVGLLLAIAFQLAHCTAAADFFDSDAPRRGADFVEHQMRTTVDVRCRTKLGGGSLRWLMGGLDFQVEHHLAPRLPHTVYPVVARRLDRVCAQRHIAVRQFASPWQALRAHARWLRVMGTAPVASPRVLLESRTPVVDRPY